MKRSIYTLFFTAFTLLGYAQPGLVIKLLNTIELNDVDVPANLGGGFGSSVVSIGDLNKDGVEDLAVGAIDIITAGNAGAVYILFMNRDGTIKNSSKIATGLSGFAFQTGINAKFGSALAYLGDLDSDGSTELAVGSPWYNGQGAREGAVWILSINSNGIVQKSLLIGENAGGFADKLERDDHFGFSLGMMPDVDNDGIPELLVGSPNRQVNSKYSGRIYLLKLGSTGWVKNNVSFDDQSLGIAGALGQGFRFGEALTTIKDLDSNGISEIVVGVPGDTSGFGTKGSVWILSLKSRFEITKVSRLSNTSPGFSPHDTSCFMGNSLTNLGDIDGDGIDDIATGSLGGYGDSISTNVVRIIFLDKNAAIKSTSALTSKPGSPGIPMLNPNFNISGRAVSVLNDIDGDGKRDLIVGSPNWSNGFSYVHIFTLDGVSRIGLEEKAIQPDLISIFPNPTSGSFSVSLSQEFLYQNLQMVLLGASGRKLWAGNVENLQTTQMELELNQPAGIYYLHCKAGGLMSVNKIVISY